MQVGIPSGVLIREVRGNMQENDPSTQRSESNLETLFMRNVKNKIFILSHINRIRSEFQ
jgi:hypothetical protein